MLRVVRRSVTESGGAIGNRRRRMRDQGCWPRGWERTSMSDSDVDRDSEPEFVPVASYGFYEWINRHPWSIAAVLVVLAVGLAALYGVVADQSEPSFDPKGPIYDTRDHVNEVFASSSSIREVLFIVENPAGGDVLSRDALLELKQNQDALLADPESRNHLATTFARDLGVDDRGRLLNRERRRRCTPRRPRGGIGSRREDRTCRPPSPTMRRRARCGSSLHRWGQHATRRRSTALPSWSGSRRRSSHA